MATLSRHVEELYGFVQETLHWAIVANIPVDVEAGKRFATIKHKLHADDGSKDLLPLWRVLVADHALRGNAVMPLLDRHAGLDEQELRDEVCSFVMNSGAWLMGSETRERVLRSFSDIAAAVDSRTRAQRLALTQASRDLEEFIDSLDDETAKQTLRRRLEEGEAAGRASGQSNRARQHLLEALAYGRKTGDASGHLKGLAKLSDEMFRTLSELPS